MEMVERVARAIADKDGFEPYRDIYIAKARAAIEAMREPTDAMADAGFNADTTTASDIWRAMIDSALIAHDNPRHQRASTVNETQGKAGTDSE